MLQREHSAICSTCIKPPSVFKTFVLSIFEWPLKTGYTVCIKLPSVFKTFVLSFFEWPLKTGFTVCRFRGKTVMRCKLSWRCERTFPANSVFYYLIVYIWYLYTVEPVYNGHSQIDSKLLFKTHYRLIQVKIIAECSKVTILLLGYRLKDLKREPVYSKV